MRSQQSTLIREVLLAQGLIRYGDDRAVSYHQAGIYVGRTLNGEKPADLPVLRLWRLKQIYRRSYALSFSPSLNLMLSWDQSLC
jgi:hypothetical protein